MINSLNFDDYGLTIGLISYSFKTDGKELFKNVFEGDLFKNHRNNLQQYTNEPINKWLYQPKGYRLFGNHGIAVLSLIDDYAFCNRVFNDNHTLETEYKWSAKIITGVGDDGEDDLYNKSRQTFLRETDRYPFIGIMKLKIDHKLLYGRGIKYTRLIKRTIPECLPSQTAGQEFEYIVVDCFDNDEMSVIALSNSMNSIHDFMEKIREIKHCSILELAAEEDKDSFHIDRDKHIFTSCHISLGYDVDYDYERDNEEVGTGSNKTNRENTPTFIHVARQELFSSEGVYLNFLCEAKPGHAPELIKQIRGYFEECKISTSRYTINTSITGGSVIHITLPAVYIGKIEEMCLKQAYSDHIRKVKISLRSSEDKPERESNITQPHEQSRGNDTPFGKEFIEDMKKILNRCGVSKSIRERLLSLYHLYNESAGNLLHKAYFKELEDALRSEELILKDFMDDETKSVKEMDKDISNHIVAFEEAFYNRFHEKGLSSNNLEYNGSVQQYLTCFDFLYKQLSRLLIPPVDSDTVYKTAFASITGHDRVSSTRRNLQLNISHITYPEFFATTVWKEIANHLKPILEKLPQPTNEQAESYRRFGIWKEFINTEASFEKIRFFLDRNSLGSHRDDTFRLVQKRLNKELLEYFIADQIVFHFGFQRNYELYWHFYWKTFLQTSTVYSRKGEIDRKLFIDMLLRLLVVAENNLSDEEKATYCTLYDSSMVDLWLSCYDKVGKCAKSIFHTLDTYGFALVCEDMIYLMERQLSTITPYLKYAIDGDDKDMGFIGRDGNNPIKRNQRIIAVRQLKTKAICATLSSRRLAVPSRAVIMDKYAASPDFAICLLYSLMREIMHIDLDGKETAVIKSVPRDSDGMKQLFIKEPEVAKNIVNLPADPFGGVLIPNFTIRKRYFSARTAFYRSIWHYKMISESL